MPSGCRACTPARRRPPRRAPPSWRRSPSRSCRRPCRRCRLPARQSPTTAAPASRLRAPRSGNRRAHRWSHRESCSEGETRAPGRCSTRRAECGASSRPTRRATMFPAGCLAQQRLSPLREPYWDGASWVPSHSGSARLRSSIEASDLTNALTDVRSLPVDNRFRFDDVRHTPSHEAGVASRITARQRPTTLGGRRG